MPEQQQLERRIDHVSLDEKSARTIARGRISALLEHRNRAVRKILHNLPHKRNAWIRAVEKALRQALGESLISLVAAKRFVLFYCLDPIEERPGWLSISGGWLQFSDVPISGSISLISAHAIARLMERRREVNPVTAFSSECLHWTLLELTFDQRFPFVIVPTQTGYFVVEGNAEFTKYVFTTWLADRQLSDVEQKILAKLRLEKRLGVGNKLADVV